MAKISKPPVKTRPKSKHSKREIIQKEPKYLTFKTEKDIAMHFATQFQRRFDHLIKASILFGSQVSGDTKPGSDIDIVIMLDDAAISWDEELTAWNREELGKLISEQDYKRD